MLLSYSEIQKIKSIAMKFNLCDGVITHVMPVDGGRINSTYKITVTSSDDTHSYMLQRVNEHVFKNSDQVMSNAIRVTEHLRNNGYESLEYVYAKNGDTLLRESSGVYRMTKFIHAEVFQNITRPEDMRSLGVAVGSFFKGLADFDAKSLFDTIPNFHNTQIRYENLLASALNNMLNSDGKRVKETASELKFVDKSKELVGIIVNALTSGKIPTRVTHNDTKLNNVLFDRKTNQPRCLIDLDTVMSGSILYDMADAIRSGANTGSEEERRSAKVRFDLGLMKEFLEGFVKAAPGMLTEQEIKLLPLAIKIIPLELGMRFLTDYYDGDKYFKIVEKDDNLVRARVQFALVKDIERKMEKIEEIVHEVIQ